MSWKETPVGRVPLSLSAAAGEPVVVTVKEPEAPCVKLVLFALVKAGGSLTVSVKLWLALGEMQLDAVKLIW